MKAQCAKPTVSLPSIRIHGRTIFEGLLDFGQANSICFGVEPDGDELFRLPLDLDLSDQTAFTAVRRSLLVSQRHSVLSLSSGSLLSVRARTSSIETWLDVKIHHFSIPRTDVQNASNVLFMSLEQQVEPKAGYAGHFRVGDRKDLVGPFDENEMTVRDLLNLIVTSSKGAMWITTKPHIWAKALPGQFWQILEYSDPAIANRAGIEQLEQSITSKLPPQ